MNFKKLIFFLILFSNFIVNSATLKFVNGSKDTLKVKLVGWKRGIPYTQEKQREVKPRPETEAKEGEWELKWSPDIATEIKQDELEVYDKDNKLVEKIKLPQIEAKKEAAAKGAADKKEAAAVLVTVPKGYMRTITYAGKGAFGDMLDLTGRKLSNTFSFGADLLEKAREFVIDAIYAIFGIQRKLIRDKKDHINSAPYEIAHDDPYSKIDARVRAGGSVAGSGEQAVFNKRRIFAKTAQENFLGKEEFENGEKPLVIAFVASGGGQRARLCTIGSVFGAQDICLFDCGMYLATLSGSTWFLAPWLMRGVSLNEYMKTAIKEAEFDLVFKASDVIVETKRFADQLLVKFGFGQPLGFVDFYGALLATNYLSGLGVSGNPQRCYLSSLADKINDGKSIIPIFAAVTAEAGFSQIWCEFTPWEFGSRWFGRSGAYIPIWAFGRKFDNLKCKNWGTDKDPLYESMQTLGFLMGIWGSAPAANFGQIYDQAIKGNKAILDKPFGDIVMLVLEFLCKKTDFKKFGFCWADINNFMYNWKDETRFSKYKYLKLADAGVKYINPIFPTYRRPAEGKVKDGAAPDVIIVWDSGASDAKKELEMQVEYAKHSDKRHPFPKIDLDKVGKDLVTVFSENPNPNLYQDYEIPTVIYFKIKVDTSKSESKGSDPKLKEIAAKLKNFKLEACMKEGQCKTFNFKYDKQIAQSLVDMARFNTIASADIIKEALRKRLEINRKRDGIAARPAAAGKITGGVQSSDQQKTGSGKAVAAGR